MIELHTIYQPISDFVVVEFLTFEKTDGGVIVPDSIREERSKKMAWKVLATGPDCKYVKLGDYVMPGPLSRPIGIPLLVDEGDNVKHVQLHEYEILGKVNATFVDAEKERKKKLLS